MPKSRGYTSSTRITSRGECHPITYLCPVDIYQHLQQVSRDIGRSIPLQIDTMLRRDMNRGMDRVINAATDEGKKKK